MITGQNSKQYDKSFTVVTMINATCDYPILSQTCVWIIPMYNMQTHANTCLRNHCFLRPGRSICTWGSMWSSKIGVTENREEHVHSVKKNNWKKVTGDEPSATGTQTPGLIDADSQRALDRSTIYTYVYCLNIYACISVIKNLYAYKYIHIYVCKSISNLF